MSITPNVGAESHYQSTSTLLSHGTTTTNGDEVSRMNGGGSNPEMGETSVTHKTCKTLPPAKSNSEAVMMAVPYRNSSPDSACETDILSPDQLSSPCLYTVGNVSSSLIQDRGLNMTPNMHPLPPQTPVICSTATTSPNTNGLSPTWQQDSDGDSGITNFGERLGSTSSSEAEHSSSGLPDVYLARLQPKPLCRTGPRPMQLMSNGFGPVRGDHTIPVVMKHADITHLKAGSASDQIRPSDPNQGRSSRNMRYRASTPINVSMGFSTANRLNDNSGWLHQRSFSATEFRSPWNVQGTSRRSSHELGSRPVSLDGEQLNRRNSSQQYIISDQLRVTNHSQNPNGPSVRGKSLSSEGVTVLGRMSTSQQGKSALYVNVYENLSGSDSEGSVFHSDDLIKVHARPASVIPASGKPLPTTPRQAKSADAAVRRRRLQKAFSMACVVDYNDFIDVHARVASVIPVNVENDTEQKSKTDIQQSCRTSSVNNGRLQEVVHTPESRTSVDTTDHSRRSEIASRLHLPKQPCVPKRMSPNHFSYKPPMSKSLSNPAMANSNICKNYDNHRVLISRTVRPASETAEISKLLQMHRVQKNQNEQESNKLMQFNSTRTRSQTAQENQSNSYSKVNLSKQSPVTELVNLTSSAEFSLNGDLVAYAKVNKMLKSEKSFQGCLSPASDMLSEENEPPLPPRNYRSDPFGKSFGAKSSLAERVQDLTRTAREALRKAFSMEWLNEKEASGHLYQGTKRKSGRTKNPSPSNATNPKLTMGNRTPALQTKCKANIKKLSSATIVIAPSKMNSSNYTEIL